MKTTVVRKCEIKRKWWLVDASGVRLGNFASSITKLLQGKTKALYTPNLDCGDYVIVINSKRINVYPKRLQRKIYYRHSGFPGGLRQMNLEEMLKKKPNEVIKKAVWGMMPKTKLGRAMMKKLYIYEGENHEHEAQKPKLINILQIFSEEEGDKTKK